MYAFEFFKFNSLLKHCVILPYTAQKMIFSIKDFFSKCDQILSFFAHLTEEILNGKLHFLCSDILRCVT